MLCGDINDQKSGSLDQVMSKGSRLIRLQALSLCEKLSSSGLKYSFTQEHLNAQNYLSRKSSIDSALPKLNYFTPQFN
ncbi:hypothetical protein PGT21_028441 [Puccinia graminis f. sp. tritici]|uniref:Uncharacterized protein n=1 Tax=Puccinia graminis f. sp. tritici TaxID=56615 RepID=A0A5B0PUK3_PUCGR|nr:hypothetical protein PGT21_028441 [Puccinia graminis f. sp. tritici]